VIDLFAGAGGMTAGFTKFMGHAFESVWANDFNKWAADTYNANFGQHCKYGDIVDILADPRTRIPKADVVVGGPPCQGFSLLNKNRVGDPRKELWRPYMEVVERSGASIFVMENVPQILASPEFEMIKAHAEGLGFKLTYWKVCAANYGVPQTRWRAIVIGCKFRNPDSVFPPKKTHYDPRELKKDSAFLRKGDYVKKARPWKTVRDAIANLKMPVGTEIRSVTSPNNLHFGRNPTPKSMKRYRAIPDEGMNRVDLLERAPELTPDCWVRKKSGGTDLFGRLWWDRPAVTMRTEFYKPEKGRYLHPQQHRPITHREAARFQSFPDEFVFTGTKIEVARQIGNAVPPMLAARLADVVYALLYSKQAKSGRRIQ
jgi:DNA (cytosine-5)-methyltransferase 1